MQNKFIRQKNFVLSLHYNGHESYLFENGVQQLKFKADDAQILNEKLCLGDLSNNWTSANSAKRDDTEKCTISL